MRYRPRRRQAHPAADRLDEADGRVADLGLGLDVGQLDRGEAHGGRPDPDGRRADVSLAEMTGAHDPPVLDLDERAQLVRLAEPVARPEILEAVQPVGRRVIVVGDPELEGDLRRPGDRLRRDPGHRGDGRLETLRGHSGHLVRDAADRNPGGVLIINVPRWGHEVAAPRDLHRHMARPSSGSERSPSASRVAYPLRTSAGLRELDQDRSSVLTRLSFLLVLRPSGGTDRRASRQS